MNMQKLLIGVALGLCSLLSFGQESVEIEGSLSDDVIIKHSNLPLVREVYGGTKIIPSYKGNWTNEMKGAFEYACKIWEEVIPSTFPIHILVKIDENKETTAFSNVSARTMSHVNQEFEYRPFSNLSTWLQIKGTTFSEMIGEYNTKIYHTILTKDMFDESNPDVTITYYNKGNKLIDNFSFALDTSSDPNMYDFVTVALRDIAKSFGLIWNRTIVKDEQFRTDTQQRYIPYETLIWNALGGDEDAHKAYLNAIKDSLLIASNKYKLVLYAPKVWNPQRSLNYMIPNKKQKISQLLTYDLGRGTVIRDINDDYTDLFREILKWKGDNYIGIGGSGDGSASDIITSTEKIIPYNGVFTINSSNTKETNTVVVAMDTDKQLAQSPYTVDSNDSKVNVDSLSRIYSPLRNRNPWLDFGWYVDVLLVDGTWDNIYNYKTYDHTGKDLIINTKDFKFHHDPEKYARTCDGYLRCRFTYTYLIKGSMNSTGFSRYYVMDYLPPKIKMRKSKVLPATDEYLRDVVIGLKDIEGTTNILVTQKDEDSDNTYEYEVPDFKSGKFTATVDKEFSSTFIITAYNKNGQTESDPYILKPLSPPTSIDLHLWFENEKLLLERARRYQKLVKVVDTYRITAIEPTMRRMVGINNIETPMTKTAKGEQIDVSSLPKGTYLLTVKDIKGGIHSLKFTKK